MSWSVVVVVAAAGSTAPLLLDHWLAPLPGSERLIDRPHVCGPTDRLRPQPPQPCPSPPRCQERERDRRLRNWPLRVVSRLPCSEDQISMRTEDGGSEGFAPKPHRPLAPMRYRGQRSWLREGRMDRSAVPHVREAVAGGGVGAAADRRSTPPTVLHDLCQ